MQVYKRQQRSGFEQQQQSAAPQDPTSERLQTLGMRIRQSISNGYKLPEDSISNSAAYMNNYEQQQTQNNSRRVPLPAHLGINGPPALDYNGSTASHLDYIESEVFWNRLYHTPNYSYSTDEDDKDNDTNWGTIGSIDEVQESRDSATVSTSDQASTNSPGDSVRVNHDAMVYAEKPIGAELVNSCLDLLFTLSFTVESRSKSGYSSPILANDYQPIVWEPGLEVQGSYRDTKVNIDSNRLEIVRLMLVLFSKSLYIPSTEVVNAGSRFLTVLVAATDGRKFYILCLSLWNTIARSIHTNDSNSNSNMDVSGNVNGLDIPVEEHKNLRILMVTNSLQLFTLMVVYPLPKKDISFLFKHNILSNNDVPRTRSRIFLSKITSSKDIQIIIKTFTAPLFKPIIDNDLDTFSYLMKTSKLIDDKELHTWGLELMMILLEFFQCNARFRAHFAELVGPDFFVLLLFYILKFKNEKKHASFVKLCVYFLLIITADFRLSSKLLASFDAHLYDSLPQILRTSTTPTSYRDFLIIHICNIISSDYDFVLLPPLIEILYNLIPLHATILAYNRRENREILGNRRIKDLSRCPPSQMSYAASTSLIHVVNKLSKYNNVPNDFILQLDHLSLIFSACCQAIFRDPYDTVVLMYVFAKNANIFARLTANIKRVSDQLFTDMIQKERRDYDREIQQQRMQLQQQIQASQELQRPVSQIDNESRDSLDLPVLSRQSTQNTLESIPSMRSMPVVTKQTSQLSTPSISSGLISSFTDDSIDPMSANYNGINNNGNIDNNNGNNNSNNNNTSNNSNNNNNINNTGVNGQTSNEESKETDNGDSAITPFNDEVFSAELPLGMTARSKEKQAYYEKFDQKWSGKEAFDLLRESLKIVSSAGSIRPTSETKAQQPQDASAIIQKLLKRDLDSLFSKIEKSDIYDPSRMDFQPLKFKWTRATLGWYISLLWGNIFLNYNSFAAKGLLAEISLGFSVFKKASSSWGFGSWKLGSGSSSPTTPSASSPSALPTSIFAEGYSNVVDFSVYYDNILKQSIWFGTHIQLFRVNPVLLRDHYTLQHGKSELSSLNGFNGNTSPSFSEVFWKRNTVTSPTLGMRNGSGVFTEGFWKRQGGRPSSIDRRDSDGSLKIQLSRSSNGNVNSNNAVTNTNNNNNNNKPYVS
ncbi:hypothetical protein PMKS-000339 [Pichia membranifaciens]|uniref:Damage-regulated import facilitator 1 n=1 Tax=Pichia membranifaciens TaxID=4926 RepID=A0A1Q2YBK8_9ASCO|nr:hypothetical protein PMKS-000339 [Pichia membranifaciens]